MLDSVNRLVKRWNGTEWEIAPFDVPAENVIGIEDYANKVSDEVQNFNADLSVQGNTVYHQGNDGTGSGLDLFQLSSY